MQEVKSIENTLIKISVRTLWVIGIAIVGSVWMAASFYNSLMASQERLLNEFRSSNKDVQYQIKDLNKDVSGLQEDVKNLKQTIR